MSSEQNNIFWTRFFYLAAFFNWYVSLSNLFSPLWLLNTVAMTPPFEHTLYEQAFYGLIGVFGFVYFFVARDLSQRRFVQVGLLSKLVW